MLSRSSSVKRIRIFIIIQNKRRVIIVLIPAILLLIPLVAMEFTDEVNWDLFDFVIMGTVLLAIGVLYERGIRKSKKTVYRIALGTALVGAFLLFWVNGAVGIIGNEGQNANLLYGAVLIVGSVGAIIVRFNPKGMSNTLFVMASIQMLVPVMALVIWPPSSISWSPSVVGVFLFSGFFALLFLLSAALFKQATTNENLFNSQ